MMSVLPSGRALGASLPLLVCWQVENELKIYNLKKFQRLSTSIHNDIIRECCLGCLGRMLPATVFGSLSASILQTHPFISEERDQHHHQNFLQFRLFAFLVRVLPSQFSFSLLYSLFRALFFFRRQH